MQGRTVYIPPFAVGLRRMGHPGIVGWGWDEQRQKRNAGVQTVTEQRAVTLHGKDAGFFAALRMTGRVGGSIGSSGGVVGMVLAVVVIRRFRGPSTTQTTMVLWTASLRMTGYWGVGENMQRQMQPQVLRLRV